MSSVRESLEAAFEKVEGGEASSANTGDGAGGAENSGGAGAAAAGLTEAQPKGAGDVADTEATGDSKARDPKGRFAKANPKKVKIPGGELHQGSGQEQPATDTLGQAPDRAGAPSPPPPSQPEALKAPQSWKANLREKWGTLPRELQEEVLRREKEISSGLEQHAGSKKFQQEWQQTIGPYEAMIRAEGANPLGAVQNLLQTAMALRTAPPQHKAQLLAQMIHTFGVPIEALAAAIDGQPSPQQQAPGPYRDPRVDQLFQQIQAAQHQQQHSLNQRAHQDIAAFSEGKEFFEDVRLRMSAIMSSGLPKTLEQAYDEACWGDPHVRAVLQQREAAKAAANAQASTQRARAAASSVKSEPAGVASPKPQGIRASLEAAWAKQQSGR